MIMRIRVDLPDPLGPVSPYLCPGRKERETSSKRVRLPIVLEIFCKVTMDECLFMETKAYQKLGGFVKLILINVLRMILKVLYFFALFSRKGRRSVSAD
jgi:hypothetical protein